MIYSGLIHSPSRERNKSSGDCLYLSLALPWFTPLREAFCLICHACMGSSDLAPYPGTEAECSMERHGTRFFLQRGKLGETVVCFTWKQWNLCRKFGKLVFNNGFMHNIESIEKLETFGSGMCLTITFTCWYMLLSPRDSLYWSIWISRSFQIGILFLKVIPHLPGEGC